MSLRGEPLHLLIQRSTDPAPPVLGDDGHPIQIDELVIPLREPVVVDAVVVGARTEHEAEPREVRIRLGAEGDRRLIEDVGQSTSIEVADRRSGILIDREDRIQVWLTERAESDHANRLWPLSARPFTG